MAQMRLFYPPQIENIVTIELQDKPGLKEAYKRLEDSIETNPRQASPETFILSNGAKVHCYRKSIRATSYSKHMVFSKDEIVILYEILEDRLRVIYVYFPS